MTREEFLANARNRNMQLAPGALQRDITMTNTLLQGMRAAMLPIQLQEFYTITSGITNGAGYIFGPNEIPRGAVYPIPSIVTINQEMSTIPETQGKTIFGRNDLFLFAFDAFGVFYMLDNLTLRPLRKYDNMYRAMTDCLAAGKL